MTDFKQTIEDRIKKDGENFFYSDVNPDGYDYSFVKYPSTKGKDLETVSKLRDEYRQKVIDYTQSLWDKMSYTFEKLDRTGGMDEGYHVSQIYKFTDKATGEELYVDFYGHHISHDGSYYDGYRFVTPKQKTVTVYN